jgi:hypothetical protein
MQPFALRPLKLRHSKPLAQTARVLTASGVDTGFAQGMDAFLVSPKVSSAKASGLEWLEPLG